jgi:uncharacterized linocin/CFP29 family protein
MPLNWSNDRWQRIKAVVQDGANETRIAPRPAALSNVCFPVSWPSRALRVGSSIRKEQRWRESACADRENRRKSMETPNEINWPDALWKEINDAVLAEAGKIRACQKVFPTTVLKDHVTEVPNQVINFTDMSIREGSTKPLAEIYLEFALTREQVSNEGTARICKTLARMAAKSIALAEDAVIFQGQKAVLPANVKVDLIDSTGDGLLGEAGPQKPDDDEANSVSVPIDVRLVGHGRSGVLYGENTFAAVASGIAKLVRKAQAPEYALFLPTRAYADTFAPPGDQSLTTTADRIEPLVKGGFHGTGALPPDRGLLVALGGEPTSIFVGREAAAEFVHKEGSRYFFRVVERIQFVARDPRAFVLLRFEEPPREARKGA